MPNPNPPRSRRRDDDDRDNRPDPRRSGGGSGLLIPLLLLGGVFLILVVVGGIGIGISRAQQMQKAQLHAEMDRAEMERATAQARSDEAERATRENPLAPQDLGGGAEVTLKNLRRERGADGKEELVVDYEFTKGFPLTTKDVLVVVTPTGRTLLELDAIHYRNQTLRVSPEGLQLREGPIEVWYERKTTTGRRETTTRISNKLTLE